MNGEEKLCYRLTFGCDSLHTSELHKYKIKQGRLHSIEANISIRIYIYVCCGMTDRPTDYRLDAHWLLLTF